MKLFSKVDGPPMPLVKFALKQRNEWSSWMLRRVAAVVLPEVCGEGIATKKTKQIYMKNFVDLEYVFQPTSAVR